LEFFWNSFGIFWEFFGTGTFFEHVLKGENFTWVVAEGSRRKEWKICSTQHGGSEPNRNSCDLTDLKIEFPAKSSLSHKIFRPSSDS
jgi:hypothetical protein